MTRTYVQQDLADGTIVRLLGTRIIDGELFTLALDAHGKTWAYTPHHIALLTGEIAREVSR